LSAECVAGGFNLVSPGAVYLAIALAGRGSWYRCLCLVVRGQVHRRFRDIDSARKDLGRRECVPGLTRQLHCGLNGVGAAGHGEFAVAEGLPAVGADGEWVEVGAAGVLDDDRLGAGVDVPVAPFFEREEDGL
jgi:hypothetical protein